MFCTLLYVHCAHYLVVVFFLLLKVVQRLKLKACRTRFTFYAIIIMNLRIYAFISLLEIYINSVQKIALYVIRDKKRQLDCSMSSALFYDHTNISHTNTIHFSGWLEKNTPNFKVESTTTTMYVFKE